MKKVDVPVLDANDCEQRLRRTRLGPHFQLSRSSFVCAGGEQGKDACTVIIIDTLNDKISTTILRDFIVFRAMAAHLWSAR